MGQIAAAYATTTVTESLTSYGLPNTYLNLFVIGEIALALFLMYNQTAQVMLGTCDLPLNLLLLPIVVSFVPITLTEELRKSRSRKTLAARNKLMQKTPPESRILNGVSYENITQSVDSTVS